MENEIRLNGHNKQEHRPSHSAEHILNRTMVNMFGCPRSRNAHIEKKKSKCDYLLQTAPTEAEVEAIADKVNEIIAADLPVTTAYISRSEAAGLVDLSKLPEDASETLRIVRIGDYDVCACIGDHVGHTAEIGRFQVISHEFTRDRSDGPGIWRLRWRLIPNK